MLQLITTVDIFASGESPSIMPEISPSDIGPGFPGFVLTFSVVVVAAILIVDMVRRIRRVRYRAQVAERTAAENAESPEPEARNEYPADLPEAPAAGTDADADKGPQDR
ncbi:hypothetical protein ODZ83_07385 [Acaricomes phytoseiuli]|uniref:hypothetical protein n=1 Tax=Acaricomes phytoseiuli TaxID=291968 RepID=UPI00036A9F4C|nr:hypothetical protein [Acaricomes phytoseiuli]MCW1250005.1 hypothetical protein [Acaricomes phytoseiuli]